MTIDNSALSVESAAVIRQEDAWQRVRRSWSVRIGGGVLLVLLFIALAAPWLGTVDPTLFDAGSRDLTPGQSGEITTLDGDSIKHTFLMGSDSFGRDIYSRVLYGTRVSLLVGAFSAVVALAFGIVLGLTSGYLALARRAAHAGHGRRDGHSRDPDRDRAGRNVAGQPYVGHHRDCHSRNPARDAARKVAGAHDPRRALCRGCRVARHAGVENHVFHILPNTVAPLLVQGTYICAFGILVEAILSFLGVGLPPDIPTWGNIMAEGRVQFVTYPHNVFFPGTFLAATVLAVNILGDGLRDTLDPKMARRS